MIRGIAAVAWMLCGAAQACGGPSDTIVEGKSYTVAYRTVPARIATGQHFAIDLTVCPRDKAPLPRSVRVDAGMPEHRHGMNYRPTVKAMGHGRYRAEGMLFHMSGRWEIAFDLVAAGGTERITSSLLLE